MGDGDLRFIQSKRRRLWGRRLFYRDRALRSISGYKLFLFEPKAILNSLIVTGGSMNYAKGLLRRK